MMAIPFALPEDEISNLIATVIFILSQTRLHRNENSEIVEAIDELMGLLTEEIQRRARSSEYDHQLKQMLVLLREALEHFPRGPRSSQFEYMCDDCKISFHEDFSMDDTDCTTQVGFNLRKTDEDDTTAICKERVEEKEEFVQETIFSRLVPGVRWTFWTAVPLICMVGWHLFQISYSM